MAARFWFFQLVLETGGVNTLVLGLDRLVLLWAALPAARRIRHDMKIVWSFIFLFLILVCFVLFSV